LSQISAVKLLRRIGKQPATRNTEVHRYIARLLVTVDKFKVVVWDERWPLSGGIKGRLYKLLWAYDNKQSTQKPLQPASGFDELMALRRIVGIERLLLVATHTKYKPPL
jgi:hypothetical protein